MVLTKNFSALVEKLEGAEEGRRTDKEVKGSHHSLLMI